MNNAPFDEHIKEQFAGYEPPVPAHIWENITREKDRSRPGIIWWLPLNKTFLIILISMATGAGFIWYANEYNTKENIPAPNGNTETENRLKTTSSITAKTNQKVENVLDNTLVGTEDSENAGTPGKKLKSSSNTFASRISAGSIGYENVNDNPAQINGTDESYPLTGNYSFAERLKFNAVQPGKLSNIKHGTIPTPCPDMERNTSANKKYLDFYAGPDYSMASYSDTGNSNYKQLRQASTRTAFGFSAGVRYTKVFNNSMSIRAGINYSQVNEKFTYKQGNYVQVVYIINNNGDTTGSYSVSGTRYKNSTNVYRMADIPLAVGYEMGNDRIHVNINAGVIINVYSWQKGNVVDTSNNPVDITTGTNSPYSFKTNAGIGFTAGASVYYKLNDRLHLLAEPYFRYNLSQANKPGITLKQKFNTLGIRLGLRLDIP
ncbi:MAG: hypothetical protein ABIW38_02915 [Ferruginibacter sp.]